MPKMDGLELSAKLLELDVNPKICLMSAGMINQADRLSQNGLHPLVYRITTEFYVLYLVFAYANLQDNFKLSWIILKGSTSATDKSDLLVGVSYFCWYDTN
jgi:hypothetical protein